MLQKTWGKLSTWWKDSSMTCYLNQVVYKLLLLSKIATKITKRNKIRGLDPTAVDDNNNNSVERANTVLKANNILGAYVMEEKEE